MMSSCLYVTGLWFYTGRSSGKAKLYGREVPLANPPALLGVQMAEVEYVPEVCVRRLREPHGGWREMESDEVRAADQLLLHLLPAGES
jgi:hypothetical protein